MSSLTPTFFSRAFVPPRSLLRVDDSNSIYTGCSSIFLRCGVDVNQHERHTFQQVDFSLLGIQISHSVDALAHGFLHDYSDDFTTGIQNY